MSDEKRTEYEVGVLNKIGRLPDRARYDISTVHSIFRAADLVHVGFVDAQGLPQVIPMVGALEETDNEEVFVYLHGYHAARVVRLTEEKDTPVTLSAALADGYVLALASFHHSCVEEKKTQGTENPHYIDRADTHQGNLKQDELPIGHPPRFLRPHRPKRPRSQTPRLESDSRRHKYVLYTPFLCPTALGP
jgi:hypothetical protein